MAKASTLNQSFEFGWHDHPHPTVSLIRTDEDGDLQRYFFTVESAETLLASLKSAIRLAKGE